MKKLACVVAAALLCCSATMAPVGSPAVRVDQTTDDVIVKGELARFMDGYLTRYSDYGYSFSLLVARGGEILLQKAYGPGLDPSTVFDVASVSKQFTTTAIMKLASEGKLSLNDPISRFFPDAPKDIGAVTVDQLMAHTSGIEDDYVKGAFESSQDLLAYVYSRPLARTPGQKWGYSNYGYGVLATIVARASGQPFKSYMRSELFEPAGLRNTGFKADTIWPESQRPEPIGGMTSAAGPEPMKGDAWGFGLGSGDVISSPSDIFRWLRALREGRILPEEWRAKLDEPIVEVIPNLEYGRGWWNRRVVLGSKERLNIFHSGLEETGFSAWLSRYPAEQLVTIFNTHQGVEGMPLRDTLNSATGPSLLEKLIFGGDLHVPPAVVQIDDLDRFAGTYRIDADNSIDVRARAPFLDVIPRGQRAFELLLPGNSGDKAKDAAATATERARAIFAALSRGQRDELRKYWAGDDGEPPSLEFERYEILGSMPRRRVTETSSQISTYLLLTHGGRSKMWRLSWSGDKIGSFYGSDTPIVPPFRAIDASGFANFQPFIRGSAFLRFAEEAAVLGEVRALRTNAAAH